MGNKTGQNLHATAAKARISSDEGHACSPSTDTSQRNTVKYGFDWKFCKRLCEISHVLFPSVCSISALVLYCLLVCAATEQVFIYYIGLIPSKFYAVLIPKDAGAFRILAVTSVLFVVGKAVVTALLAFTSALLYISWRRLLSRRLHELYFHGRSKCYYILNIGESSRDFVLDNPDQRMTQDVDKFCLQLSLVVAPVVVAPFKIAWYTYQTFLVTGIYGPFAIFAYFVIGTVANKFLMSPLIRYVYEQERKEGDFRYKHMQVRIYAESIAFYRSERIEYELVNQKLSSLLRILLVKARWQSLLTFSLGVFDYFGGILSYLLLAIPLFAGKYDFLTPDKLSELISRNGFVCIMLVSSFSTLVDLANQASEIAGNLHRVAQLKEVMDEQCGRSGKNTARSGKNRRFRQNACDAAVSSDDDEDTDADGVNNRRRLTTASPVACSSAHANTMSIAVDVPPGLSASPATSRPLSDSVTFPHAEELNRSTTASPTTAAELTSLTASAFCSVLGTPTSTVSDLTGPNHHSAVSRPLPYLSFELCNISFGVPGLISQPHSSLLVQNLSLLMQRGCNVLVSGPSSSGKTSLLRVLLSIWPLREGRILCRYGSDRNDAVILIDAEHSKTANAQPSRNRRLKNRLVMCLPQKSLLTNGSLKQQLVYPELVLDNKIDNATKNSADGESLVDLLRYVRLEHLLLNENGQKSASTAAWRQWEDFLSPGEQQRLSFIRVYYHQPQFVFLDEATSAVEPAMEERLYAKVKQLGITMLSVGHRESLRQYHDVELKLDGKGGWTVVSLRDGREQNAHGSRQSS